MDMNHVLLKTSDGIDIAGIYRTPAAPRGAAILLHMMPAVKESWDAFAVELDRAGFASIAIDERGHGESTMGGTLDYHNFDESQQQAKIHDVEAAFAFLLANGFVDKQIVFVGASIGANLAIRFLASHPNVPLAIAMSPGLNYRGVKTDEAIVALRNDQRVVLVASDDDDRDAAVSSRALHDLNRAQTVLIEKHGLGHGTTMFEKDSALMHQLIEQLPK